MFDRFTERSVRAIKRADRAARKAKRRANELDVLRSLLEETECLATNLLRYFDIDPAAVITRIDAMRESGDTEPAAHHDLKDAIKLKKRLKSGHVGTEHLITAMVENEDSPAGGLLIEMGVDRGSMAEVLVRLHQQKVPFCRTDDGDLRVYSRRLSELLERAIRHADREGHQVIEPEDVLAGMLTSGAEDALTDGELELDRRLAAMLEAHSVTPASFDWQPPVKRRGG